MQQDRTITARWNRMVSDVRCAIGGALIKLGAAITSASVHSHHPANGRKWDWKIKRNQPNRFHRGGYVKGAWPQNDSGHIVHTHCPGCDDASRRLDVGAKSATCITCHSVHVRILPPN